MLLSLKKVTKEPVGIESIDFYNAGRYESNSDAKGKLEVRVFMVFTGIAKLRLMLPIRLDKISRWQSITTPVK